MRKSQLHRRMTTDQVVAIVKKFLAREISGVAAARHLEIGRTRLYELVGEYSRDKRSFTVDYDRHKANNRLDTDTEKVIIEELKTEKKLIIDNPLVPTKRHNGPSPVY